MRSLKEWEEAQAMVESALAVKDEWEKFRGRIRAVPGWFWTEPLPEGLPEAVFKGLARETMAVFVQRFIRVSERGDEKTRQYLGLISNVLCETQEKE